MYDEVHDHFKTASYILIFLLTIVLISGVYTASFITGDHGIGDFISTTFSVLFIVPSVIFIGIIFLYLKLQSMHYDAKMTDRLWIILLSVFIFFMVCLVLYGLFCMLIFFRAGHWMTIITILLTLVGIGQIYFPLSMIYHLRND